MLSLTGQMQCRTPGSGQPQAQIQAGLENGLTGERLGALDDQQLHITQHCEHADQKSKHIKRGVTRRAREVISFLCSADTSPGVLHPTLELGSQNKKDMDLLD